MTKWTTCLPRGQDTAQSALRRDGPWAFRRRSRAPAIRIRAGDRYGAVLVAKAPWQAGEARAGIGARTGTGAGAAMSAHRERRAEFFHVRKNS